MQHVRRSIATVGAVALSLGIAYVTANAAHAHPAKRWYVDPNGAGANKGTSCQQARFSHIQDAVDAATAGGTVVVCPGTYHESVTVDRSLVLSGMRGSVIDATGFGYGVGVAASWTTVRGLTVVNASGSDPSLPYDGIITAGFTATGPAPADHVVIEHNTVHGNQGSGIDLNSTSHSIARHNVATENGVGINVSDDLGAPAVGNVIDHNTTNRNFGGCGIALADHTGAGVIGNVVTHNVSDDNGLSTPTAPDASAGSGVILASPIPGGVVRDNLVRHNEFHGNGHGGVVVHSHVPHVPGVPDSDFSGNRIVDNRIGTNNLRTDESDTQTTGIYLGSATPLHITVKGNKIRCNHYGIFTAGEVTVSGRNHFVHVATPLGGVPTF